MTILETQTVRNAGAVTDPVRHLLHDHGKQVTTGDPYLEHLRQHGQDVGNVEKGHHHGPRRTMVNRRHNNPR